MSLLSGDPREPGTASPSPEARHQRTNKLPLLTRLGIMPASTKKNSVCASLRPLIQQQRLLSSP
eukprot:16428628-Heterocapsa_arctica.AAC.1